MTIHQENTGQVSQATKNDSRITGWAQINGYRGETDTLEKMQERVEYDLYYIQHWGRCGWI